MNTRTLSKNSSDLRGKIRTQIQPFPRTPRYATGWGGVLTFDEICAVLSPMMTRKLTQWGMYGQDIPDSLQTGLMRLWEQLVVNPDLLAHDGKSSAMWRTLAKCNGRAHAKHNCRQQPFTDIQGDGHHDVDEYGISGYNSPSAWWNSIERWATWATATDARLDITAALREIAAQYADDINGLAALYILTTSAEFYATLDALNVRKSTVWDRMNAIRRQLQTLLADYAPDQRCRRSIRW